MSTTRTPERPLRLRRRRDLIVTEQELGGERSWIVKDPITLRFARFREQEYALFDALDGRAGIGDLVELFETRFAPRRIRPEEITRFVTNLHQLEFIVSDRPGQAEVLEKRRIKRRRRSFVSRFMNPLAIRFSGPDPTKLFDLLMPIAYALFSRTAAVAAAIYGAVAAVFIALRWPAFSAQLPNLEEFFTPDNLLLVAAVLAGVKILHEFGHGLACRRFGGECRDIGLMLLVFTPCLYCDVTDSWRFTSRMRRVIVAAAGIYIELLLAATAAIVWTFSEPGLLNRVCVNVIVVASVGTVLFNGNPLMRYDGYYILSDLLGVSNLGQRSSSVVRHFILQFLYGKHAPMDPTVPMTGRRWYFCYAVASTLYRWSISAAIVLMLVAGARPYGLENLSRAIGVLMVATLITMPLMYFRQMLPKAGRLEHMNRFRVTAVVVCVAAVLIAFFALPLPHSIVAPLELQLRDAEQVYVEIPGRITTAGLSYGAQVAPGDVVVSLENRELDAEIEQLAARCEQLRVDLSTLRREAFDNPEASRSIPHTEALLSSLEAQLEEKRIDRKRLAPVVSRGGTLFPPPVVAGSNSADESTAWTGRPLDPINIGCTLEVGTLLGRVGDPHLRQAALVMPQEDVEFVAIGDEVDVLLEALPDLELHGRVTEIALGDLRDSPRRLSSKAGGEVATRTGANSSEAPVETSYLVRVDLDDPTGRFRDGWRGTARIRVAPKPLGTRLLRTLSRTFHFDL